MAKKKGNSKKKKQDKPTTKVEVGFPSYFTNTKLLCAVLFVVSFLIYAGTLGHEFTQDDAIVITENDFTKAGDIGSLLKYDTFRGFFKVEGKANLVEGGRYRPLTPIMFALGWQINESPVLFHFMNVLWYSLTVVLLFIVLLKMLHSSSYEPYAYFVAFVTALLFAIHPIHTEVVANVKGRDEIMTLFLSLSALYFSLRSFDKKGNIAEMAIAGVLFFLALMAKEMAVVFIPIVAISFYVFRKIDIAKSLMQMIPFVIAFAAFMILRQVVLGDATSGGKSMELMNNPYLKLQGSQWIELNPDEKYGTIFNTLGRYIKLLIFPNQLTHDYYPYAIPITSLKDSSAMLSILAYAGLIAVGIWGVLTRKHFAYGIAFFLISLFLVSNLPLTIGVNMAERFMFMPSIGFCFVLAIGLYHLAKKMSGAKEIVGFGQFTGVLMILGLIFLAGATKTFTRSLDWKNNFTLFQADWQKSENSAKARNSIGGELTTRSQDDEYRGKPKEKEMLQEALIHLDVTTGIHPTYKSAYMLKGNANFYLTNYNAAIKNYQIALQLDPAFTDAENNLEKALQAKAETEKTAGIAKIENEAITASKNGNHQEAIRIFNSLLEKYPNEPKYHFFIGTANAGSGNMEAALENFKKAESLDDGTDLNNSNRMISAIIDIYTRLGDEASANAYRTKLK
jgi:TolA-binding protein